jgi:hypothetical protein
VPMGDSNLAPGPVPDTWEPGTWSSTFSQVSGTVTYYGDIDPSTPGLQCGVIATFTSGASGPGVIPGPCWGLYEVTTPGLCAGYASRIVYTAVIGNGYSYWLALESVSAPVGGETGRPLPVITNVFTPL